MPKFPVFFISHGGPNLLEDQARPGHFYSWLGNYLKNELKPKAIVIISAHWQGEGREGVFVDTSEKPKLIYDFYNFPRRYYEEKWDHKGSPSMANRVIDLLNKSGFNAIGQKYGNDHGVWVPLKRAMESNPDIPIVEVSTLAHENMQMHIKMGEALAPLRDEGVVIIGSGSAVHNLNQLWTFGNGPSPRFVVDFDHELEKIACDYVDQERKEKSSELNKHPNFRKCHPTAEHLVPFHVALGAAGNDKGKKLLEDYFSTLSWSSFGFGLPTDIKLPKYDSSKTAF
ncbi:Extradiol ring-cleavage dioxygenase, class III enzyme, subunit B [Cokeromyces recurvatus]|uniref:Extradiol ring-cleavage dioxygenase, class III enzyme, subunit B n=1 Tax=Cokeromyces recurvatus TaxID=90255 RepID=UPI00221F179C|nr:Extradiol ring-cleavage dioxygenase, class III enzyme, subunit B [Cokeromyces recurvatus]KAI7901499.1 Extradiol ring-cleavage dioxygenase, class III enzyme, subunit B [Cokeromyces recurvatus]